MSATYTKLRNGDWGIRVVGENAKPGDQIAYDLRHSRFPRIFIPATRLEQGHGEANGLILFNWCFIGLEKKKYLHETERYLVFRYGLTPTGPLRSRR